MSSLPTVRVTKIQKFCTHDGPGIRTTVFFKGCPLRCQWCHNPETQEAGAQFFYNASLCIGCGACAAVCPAGGHTLGGETHAIDRIACRRCLACCDACPTGALEDCGRPMTVDAILAAAEQDRAFYGRDGGITLSGGEPTAQSEGALALLAAARTSGIHTALETCGYFDSALAEPLVRATDLFLWDIKDTDDARHREYTGVSNRRILENLSTVDALGGCTVLRCILVRGVNTTEEHYAALAELYRSLRGCLGIEFIPYHTYGASKSLSLGGDSTAREDWIPTAADLKAARSALRKAGAKVIGARR